MKKYEYTPKEFLKLFPSESEYIFSSYPSSSNIIKFTKKLSRFQTWKRMKIFLKYLESFMQLGLNEAVRIQCTDKDNGYTKAYLFSIDNYVFQLMVTFRADFMAANNKFGMDRKFIIDHMNLEIAEYVKYTNISVEYGELEIKNKYKRLFKKFLNKFYFFIKNNELMTAWLLLQDIKPERIIEERDEL